MTALKTLRKLVLGETWALPATVALALAAASGLRLLVGPGGWWADTGGWLMLLMLATGFAVAVRRSARTA
jgi:hypothetical protein